MHNDCMRSRATANRVARSPLEHCVFPLIRRFSCLFRFLFAVTRLPIHAWLVLYQ